MAMNDITKDKINKLMDKIIDNLSYLYSRWQDEKEYEDFADYIERMKSDFNRFCKEIPMKNAVFVKGQKRPFGFVFDFEGWRVALSINSSQIRWKAKKI